MTYTLKINLESEQETKKVDYDTLQAYSEIGYLLYKGDWYKQLSKNWDFEHIDINNPIPNFIINFTKGDENDSY